MTCRVLQKGPRRKCKLAEGKILVVLELVNSSIVPAYPNAQYVVRSGSHIEAIFWGTAVEWDVDVTKMYTFFDYTVRLSSKTMEGRQGRAVEVHFDYISSIGIHNAPDFVKLVNSVGEGEESDEERVSVAETDGSSLGPVAEATDKTLEDRVSALEEVVDMLKAELASKMPAKKSMTSVDDLPRNELVAGGNDPDAWCIYSKTPNEDVRYKSRLRKAYYLRNMTNQTLEELNDMNIDIVCHPLIYNVEKIKQPHGIFNFHLRDGTTKKCQLLRDPDYKGTEMEFTPIGLLMEEEIMYYEVYGRQAYYSTFGRRLKRQKERLAKRMYHGEKLSRVDRHDR